MTVLGGIMSEPDPTSLMRLLVRCGLLLLSVVLMIFGAAAILHSPEFNTADLLLLLPSAILYAAPYAIGACETVWAFSPAGAALMAIVVGCLCTAMFIVQLRTSGQASAHDKDGAIFSTLSIALSMPSGATRSR